MFFTTAVLAVEQCHTGSWYDPNRNGEGINIEFLDGLVVGYIYTFDNHGKQIWFTMLGDKILTIETTVVVDDVDFLTKTVDTGVAEIDMITDNVLVFRYNLLLTHNGDGDFYLCDDPSCKGERVYERLTQPIPCVK